MTAARFWIDYQARRVEAGRCSRRLRSPPVIFVARRIRKQLAYLDEHSGDVWFQFAWDVNGLLRGGFDYCVICVPRSRVRRVLFLSL